MEKFISSNSIGLLPTQGALTSTFTENMTEPMTNSKISSVTNAIQK